MVGSVSMFSAMFFLEMQGFFEMNSIATNCFGVSWRGSFTSDASSQPEGRSVTSNLSGLGIIQSYFVYYINYLNINQE